MEDSPVQAYDLCVSMVQVYLYAFILRHQFPVTSFVISCACRSFSSGLPIKDELIKRRGHAVSELITGSPLPMPTGGS